MGFWPPPPLLLPFAERLSRELPDFEGADHPPNIIGMQPFSCDRIDGQELSMQKIHTVQTCLLLELATQLLIDGWAFKHPLYDRLQVERGTAHKEDLFAARFDFPTANSSFAQPPGNVAAFPWIENVDEMMGNTRPFLQARFGRADVHAPVEGHRIEGHDFGIQPLSEFKSERRLARSGRAGKNQGVRKRFG